MFKDDSLNIGSSSIISTIVGGYIQQAVFMFWKCVRSNKYLYSILPSLDGVIALKKLKQDYLFLNQVYLKM